jgi:hypothetical protein
MTNVAPHAGVLATPLQPLATPLESLAPMLQAIAPMLQPLALSLPLSPAVLVPAALQPLAVAFPASSLPLHPIPMALQPLPPALEAPAIMPTMALVTEMPSIRVALGTLDGKRVGRADLGGQRRPGKAQRGGEGEPRVKTCHAFLPRQSRAARSGVGLARTGG